VVTTESEAAARVFETLVVGAGPAGLAVAACLTRRSIPCVIVERSNAIGSSWRRHYERLHLHTDRRHSALPYVPFPAGTPRYPSREQVIAYLERYAQHFALSPRLNEEVRSIRRVDAAWTITSSSASYRSKHVVVATGYNRLPYMPAWPGQEHFGGRILHSSDYRNGESFRGQRVLVVGFGNSGGEIALDLHECGARVAVAVRGAVNIVPREILGLPILSIAIALSPLPARLSDALAAPLLRAIVGDITQLGLRKLPIGPITQIKTRARVPLVDVGTVKLIRDGSIEVLPGVRSMSEAAVTFADGATHPFDSIVVATGYRTGTDEFLEPTDPASPARREGVRDAAAGESGLHFCGFVVSPTGMLRDIGLEAMRIADKIAHMQ
jgi:hypothetical protein